MPTQAEVDAEAAKKAAEAKGPTPAPPKPASEDVDEKEEKQNPDSSKKEEGKKEEKDFGGESWLAVMKKIMADMEKMNTKKDREDFISGLGTGMEKIASGVTSGYKYMKNMFSMSPSPDEKKPNEDALKAAEAINTVKQKPGADMKEIEMADLSKGKKTGNEAYQSPRLGD